MKKIFIITLIFLFSFSLASAINVEQAELLELGDDGFVVGWNLNQGGSGSIHYGTTGSLGSTTTFEPRFLEYHQQQVDGLQPNTVYFYRAIGKDANGNAYSSAISLTRTAGILNNPEPSPTPDPQPNTPPSSSTISLPSYGSPDYYVATNGKSTNSGSKTSSWSLQHAMSTAKAGETVFVKAGNYGNIRVTQNNDGRSDAYINFIGTDSNWNPIDSSKTGRSFNRGDNVNANIMPLLQGEFVGDKGVGTGIKIQGDYVRIENFQATKYLSGIESHGDNQIIKNVYSTYHGDYRPGITGAYVFSNYAGRSITLRGDKVIVIDSMFQDAGAQALTIRAQNGRYDNILVYGENEVNPIDYYFLFSVDAINNYATNIEVYRTPGIPHGGHGIIFKSGPFGPGVTENNVLDGFLITNTILELKSPATRKNTIRNGVILVDDTSGGGATITVSNDAHHNVFEDIIIKNSYTGVSLTDTTEDGFGSGRENIFRRLVIQDTKYGVAFDLWSRGVPSVSLNNKFYDITFKNLEYLFRVRHENSGTEFHNSVIENVPLLAKEEIGTLNTNTVFDGITLKNSFSPSELTPYQESNIR